MKRVTMCQSLRTLLMINRTLILTGLIVKNNLPGRDMLCFNFYMLKIIVLDQCFSNFRQLRTTAWAVGAHADRSALVTFPLAVKSMQLRFFLRI
jgi:hypothetical protein